MKEITYTFIIPHHNCPDLLDRCLSSIPQRDDIQIVVVDDNEPGSSARADTQALMEKYARKAGYVYPAERVYINGN